MVGEETAKSGARLCEALVRVVACGRFRRVLAPVRVRELNLVCLLAVCARRCCAGCLAGLGRYHDQRLRWKRRAVSVYMC